MNQYLILKDNTSFLEKIGSTEEQIASLTKRVIQLSAHLQKHKKDYTSQRGLRKILGKRKRLLLYLLREDTRRYKTLIQKLGIRGPKTNIM
jgi:small subunit ribosomal protein S15